MKQLVRWKIAGLFALLLSVGQVWAQSNVPAGFPQFRDTGNPALDAANYSNAKQQWIQAHPAEYGKMTRGTVPAPKSFNNEQHSGFVDPGAPVQIGDRQAGQVPSTLSGQLKAGKSVPQAAGEKGVPVYVDTGNREKDRAAYRIAHSEYVSQNNRSQNVAPIRVNTGNPQADEANYRNAKADFLAQIEAELQAREQAEKAGFLRKVAENENSEKPVNQKVTLTKADYDQCSQEKKAYIDSHPEMYQIVNNQGE